MSKAMCIGPAALMLIDNVSYPIATTLTAPLMNQSFVSYLLRAARMRYFTPSCFKLVSAVNIACSTEKVCQTCKGAGVDAYGERGYASHESVEVLMWVVTALHRLELLDLVESRVADGSTTALAGVLVASSTTLTELRMPSFPAKPIPSGDHQELVRHVQRLIRTV